jgi:hypothetical protein
MGFDSLSQKIPIINPKTENIKPFSQEMNLEIPFLHRGLNFNCQILNQLIDLQLLISL